MELRSYLSAIRDEIQADFVFIIYVKKHSGAIRTESNLPSCLQGLAMNGFDIFDLAATRSGI